MSAEEVGDICLCLSDRINLVGEEELQESLRDVECVVDADLESAGGGEVDEPFDLGGRCDKRRELIIGEVLVGYDALGLECGEHFVDKSRKLLAAELKTVRGVVAYAGCKLFECSDETADLLTRELGEICSVVEHLLRDGSERFLIDVERAVLDGEALAKSRQFAHNVIHDICDLLAGFVVAYSVAVRVGMLMVSVSSRFCGKHKAGILVRRVLDKHIDNLRKRVDVVHAACRESEFFTVDRDLVGRDGDDSLALRGVVVQGEQIPHGICIRIGACVLVKRDVDVARVFEHCHDLRNEVDVGFPLELPCGVDLHTGKHAFAVTGHKIDKIERNEGIDVHVDVEDIGVLDAVVRIKTFDYHFTFEVDEVLRLGIACILHSGQQSVERIRIVRSRTVETEVEIDPVIGRERIEQRGQSVFRQLDLHQFGKLVDNGGDGISTDSSAEHTVKSALLRKHLVHQAYNAAEGQFEHERVAGLAHRVITQQLTYQNGLY